MIDIDFEPEITLQYHKDKLLTLDEDKPNLLLKFKNGEGSSELLPNILNNLFTSYNIRRRIIIFDYNSSTYNKLDNSINIVKETNESIPDLLNYVENDLKERKILLDELNYTSSFLCNTQLHRAFLPVQIVFLFNIDNVSNIKENISLFNRFVKILSISKSLNYYFIFAVSSNRNGYEDKLINHCKYLSI